MTPGVNEEFNQDLEEFKEAKLEITKSSICKEMDTSSFLNRIRKWP